MRSSIRQFLALLVAVAVTVTGLTVVVAPAAQAAKRPSFAVAPLEAMVNQAVTVSGKVQAKRGTRVKIQLKSGSRWSTIAQTRVKANKTYKKQLKFASAGVKPLRAKVARQRASLPKTIKVYRWVALTERGVVEKKEGSGMGSFRDAGPATTNGIPSSRTLAAVTLRDWNFAGNTGYSDWTIRRKCTEARAIVGLDDRSTSSAKERIQVFGDGKSLFSRDFVVGESSRVTIPVQGVLRLRLQHTTLTNPRLWKLGDRAFSNFGNLQVRCLY